MPQHREIRTIPFSQKQMFDLVADIERYPDFLPWCIDAKIHNKNNNEIIASLKIGYNNFSENFVSKVILNEPNFIEVEDKDGPFKFLTNKWEFNVADNNHCEIVFEIDFSFNSSVLNIIMGNLFYRAFKKMVSSFEDRAHSIYSIPIIE